MAVTNTYGGDFAPLRQSGAVHASARSGFVVAPIEVLWQDHVQIESGRSTTSKIYLADLPWTCILDPDLSKIHFDDAGTGQTLDIGEANDVDCLVAALDIATAAGSSSLMAAVDRANYGKQLWELCGYASLAAATAVSDRARIFATVGGAAFGAATDLFWRFVGTNP